VANERIFRCREVSRARDAFTLAFQTAKLFVEPFEIVLRPLKAKRSGDQNKRYWVLLREVAATVWVDGRQYSDEVWHEHFKRELIGREEIALPSGEVEVRGISTTTLSVGDMGTYMDSISEWCVNTGFPLDEAA
jgi:hypothetical protein